MACVFLKLKATSFPETEGLQRWSPKSSLLLLSWKRLRIKDLSEREPAVVLRAPVSTEELKPIYTCF